MEPGSNMTVVALAFLLIMFLLMTSAVFLLGRGTKMVLPTSRTVKELEKEQAESYSAERRAASPARDTGGHGCFPRLRTRFEPGYSPSSYAEEAYLEAVGKAMLLEARVVRRSRRMEALVEFEESSLGRNVKAAIELLHAGALDEGAAFLNTAIPDLVALEVVVQRSVVKRILGAFFRASRPELALGFLDRYIELLKGATTEGGEETRRMEEWIAELERMRKSLYEHAREEE